MKNITHSIILGAMVLTLSACEQTKEQLDFSKKAPDEFAVVKRAPLEMPPNYNLRPPRPGAARPQEQAPQIEAKQAVFGAQAPQTQSEQTRSVSTGENILLQKSGAGNITPGIRDKIDSETAEIAKEETPTINRILGKVGKKIDAPATVVDPVKESERIIQNQKTGKPITDGETPTIKE